MELRQKLSRKIGGWVTLTLKALFESEISDFCTFKGGTSLSKGWALINRFSEDVDIALAPEAFGRAYKTAPSHSYVKQLKKGRLSVYEYGY